MAGYRGALEAAQHRIAALEEELETLRAAAASEATPSQRLKRENASLKARLQKTRDRLREARSNFRKAVGDAAQKQNFVRAGKSRKLQAENKRLRKALRLALERCAELEGEESDWEAPPKGHYGRRKAKGPRLTAVDTEDPSAWEQIRRFFRSRD